jgi:S-methylmethionine-dependent homocysteine/selenocysteine methylase
MAAPKLPQLERLFLTDAGLETDMIFNRGMDLPCFASITLLQTATGRDALKDYFRPYLELARRSGTGFILESATWRASPDWAGPLGLSPQELDALNVDAVTMLHELRDEHAGSGMPIVVSACIGPRGDGYDPGRIMSLAEAEYYHCHQAAVLASARPDMLSALTINNVNEAIGVAHAAAATGLPITISFTVETDGRLPTGESLDMAIDAVDAATDCYPPYYMINCAHPTHFQDTLEEDDVWAGRIRGIRANASRCSHAELDGMTALDIGDPVDLGERYRALRGRFPQITVLGGCCGTDLRHVSAIAAACLREEKAAF